MNKNVEYCKKKDKGKKNKYCKRGKIEGKNRHLRMELTESYIMFFFLTENEIKNNKIRDRKGVDRQMWTDKCVDRQMCGPVNLDETTRQGRRSKTYSLNSAAGEQLKSGDPWSGCHKDLVSCILYLVSCIYHQTGNAQ